MGVGKANQGQLWDSRIHLKKSHFKKSTPVDWVGQQPGNPTANERKLLELECAWLKQYAEIATRKLIRNSNRQNSNPSWKNLEGGGKVLMLFLFVHNTFLVLISNLILCLKTILPNSCDLFDDTGCILSCGTPPGQLLVHSDPGRRQQPASALDVAVGLVVIFMTFLTPYGYVLGNLNQLRRE
nr:uncharacterized protein LOC123480515 [Desmodus rotundus]